MNEFDQYKLKQKLQKKPGPERRNVLGNKLRFVDKTIQLKSNSFKKLLVNINS